MLNLSKLQEILNEIISLAKKPILGNNSTLSQKLTAVSHTAKLGFFVAPITGQTRHLDRQTAPKGVLVRFPLMVWLIPQNKPMGEYGERLLLIPRVRPHHPNLGLLLKNLTGAFQC